MLDQTVLTGGDLFPEPAWGEPAEPMEGNAIALGHDFHAVAMLPEHGCIHYTISPSARKEPLYRLLTLSHERAAVEAASES